MKRFSITEARTPFTVLTALIAAGFVSTLAYLWTSFGGYLLGTASSRGDSDILTPIDERRFELVMGRYDRRRSLEQPAEALRNPFRPSTASPSERPNSVQ